MPSSRGQLAHTPEELGLARKVAEHGGHGLHDEAGDLALVLAQDALAPLQVVVRQDDHVLQDSRRHAGILRYRRGTAGVKLVRRRVDADGDVLVGAVVAALELRDLTPAGEGPGGPDGHQGALGARVGEAN